MSEDMRARQRRLKRLTWLRCNFVQVARGGGQIDPADVAALPERNRARVRELFAVGSQMAESGRRGEAQAYLEDAFTELETQISASWTPPRSIPDPGADLTDPRELAALVRR